jgi:hypothetical protein
LRWVTNYLYVVMHAMDGWYRSTKTGGLQYSICSASLRFGSLGGRGVTRDSDLDSTLSTDPLLAGAWSTAVVSFR